MTPQVISLSALGSTAWIPVDYKQNPFNLSIACVVSNTPNLTYQVEYTLDDIFDSAITPTAFVHNTITGKTSDFSATQTQPVRAIRLTTTAYTSGTVTMTALQGAVNPVIYTPNPVTIFQSGIPFWLPPGDGGSNGFSFTGTRGVFTLSAATPFAGLGSTVLAGCYAYIPAGAGGLAAGWYWCVMSDDTNGEIFAEIYTPGTGTPKYITSPTQLPNCTAGRITQTTAVVTVVSFTMPGGSLGPNGIMRSVKKWISSSTANNKLVRVTVGSGLHFSVTQTTASNNQLVASTRQNAGVETAQIGNRTSALLSAWDAGTSATSYSGDRTTIDTRVDQTVSFAIQIAATTDSVIIIPMQFTVQYGA